MISTMCGVVTSVFAEMDSKESFVKQVSNLFRIYQLQTHIPADCCYVFYVTSNDGIVGTSN